MFPKLRLISHKLCPFVQRAVIVATEKDIPFERIDIDLADKPAWFLAISPTGKTPLLEVTTLPGARVAILFESAVIAEYLDELSGNPLLPRDALERARHRAWIEFASGTLSAIGQLYSAPDASAFEQARRELEGRLAQVEQEIEGPWFAGQRFGLVDAAFGPAFRYLDVFHAQAGVDLLDRLPKAATWSKRLLERPSIKAAAPPDYPDLLRQFVLKKVSFLAGLFRNNALAA